MTGEARVGWSASPAGPPEIDPAGAAGAVRRRAFLLGAGGAGFLLAVSACDSHPHRAAYAGDFATMALVAALENQLVTFYRAVLAATRTQRLGPPVLAFTGLAQTCLNQHAEHAATWNSILRSAGQAPVSGVPLAGHSLVAASLGAVTTVGRAAALAAALEGQAEQTYVAAAGSLANAAGIDAAASIAPAEAMHAATLRFLLGEDPAPLSFAGTMAAATVADLTS
jgi:ferritin-like protein